MKLLLVFLGTIAAAAVFEKLCGSGGDGVADLVDNWLMVSDLLETSFQPDIQNVYHLFTRQNPTTSQPVRLGFADILSRTNYNPNRRTVFIIHGWTDNVLGSVNNVLVPAFLDVEDVNVFCVDWSAGAGTMNYATALTNTVTSGESVARFINWLMSATGTTPAQIHLVGHSLGGHQSGIIGRNVNGNISYITALDPALPGWLMNENKFQPNDGAYTEVIHTNSGMLGYMTPLGHVDFYPNGGINMPGCFGMACDHDICIHYLAASLSTGGFTGTRCESYVDAFRGNCVLWGTLEMGGIRPKTGNSGIFYLETNAAPPYSKSHNLSLTPVTYSLGLPKLNRDFI